MIFVVQYVAHQREQQLHILKTEYNKEKMGSVVEQLQKLNQINLYKCGECIEHAEFNDYTDETN
mgnify:FL=1